MKNTKHGLATTQAANNYVSKSVAQGIKGDEPKQTLVVVLGMHRSGTSTITRALKVLGVELGDTMIPPVEGENPKGFWEDIHLNALNIEMLAALHNDWHHLSVIEQSDVELLRDKGYFLSAVELLRKKMSGIPVFGFKDPRVAKLLPFWKEVFNHCQCDVRYILAVRHPLSVVKSLAKRDGFDAEKIYLLWLSHVLTCLSVNIGSNRILVDYDHLIQSPDHELSRIADQCALRIDPEELQCYKNDFLDQNLRHTFYRLEDLFLDDACPPMVREVYAALLDLASDKIQIDDSELLKKIEIWTTEFKRANVLLALADKLYLQKNTSIQTIAERDGQIETLKQSVVERDGQIASLNQTVAECDGQIASLNQTVTERDGQITSLNQTVVERDNQIARLNQAVAERDGRIAAFISSTSWRLTRPLRWCGRQLRRVKRYCWIS